MTKIEDAAEQSMDFIMDCIGGTILFSVKWLCIVVFSPLWVPCFVYLKLREKYHACRHLPREGSA
jgi:hypothetical protein